MVRNALKSDASRLAEILIFAKRLAYRQIFNDDETSFNEMQVLPLALYYRDDEDSLENVFVYDEVIVKAMMSLAFHENALEIKELYVDPFFQGEGIGKKLMITAFSLMKENAVTEVFLWVLEKNTRGIAFYEGLGFSFCGERRVEEGTDVYVLKYVNNCAANIFHTN